MQSRVAPNENYIYVYMHVCMYVCMGSCLSVLKCDGIIFEDLLMVIYGDGTLFFNVVQLKIY